METRSEVSDAFVMERPVAPEPLGLPEGGGTVGYGENSLCVRLCVHLCVCACVCMCVCVCVCACHVSLNMETSTVFQYDSISLFCNVNSLLRNVLPCAYTCTCVHVYVLRSQKISNTQ